MKMRLFAIAGTTLALAASAFAVDTPEVEPNETKAQATTNPTVTMAVGDTLSGQTTGTSTTVAGAASADTFRIRTAADVPAIYRYQLTASCPTGTGVSASIRGLSQSAGVIGTTDSTLQTGSGSGTPASPRVNQWYGFGAQEELFYRVTGGTTSTPYSAALSRTTVTPIAGGSIVEGNILIARAAGNTTDTDFWVYDSSFNPIATNGQDDAISPATGLTRAFTPGTYYLAISNFNVANNQPSPVDDAFRSGTVADFANFLGNSSSTTAVNCGVTFTSSNAPGSPLTVPATKAAAFDVVFIQFTVAPNVLPTNPAITTTSVTPAGPKVNGDAVTITATVVPGANPTSTGIAVTGNLTSIGGGASVSFLDNGVAPDAVAGDNIFTVGATITGATPGNAAITSIIATDAQARSSSAASATVLIGEDLGALVSGTPVSVDRALAAGQVRWFRFSIPVAIADPGNWFDAWTVAGTPALSNGDSEIGIYTSAGALEDFNDDGGTGNYSSLSYGRTAATPARPRGGADLALGNSGGLAAGTYWLAMGAFDTAFGATNFGATSTSTATGNVALNLDYSENTVPTNPTGVGSTSGTFATCSNSTLLVTVTPGQNPTSTGIAVTAGLTAFNLSATEPLFDDGAHNDGAAGDNVFGIDLAVPGSMAEGPQTISFNITDAQARSGSGSVGVVIDSKGNLPATSGRAQGNAQASTISGYLGSGDVDMVAICVTDTTAFGASVVGGTTVDTQMFLFDSTGAGVAMDDDEPAPGTSLQSNITGFTLPTGSTFYLAIAAYDNDPKNSAGEYIWADTPFDVVRAPDGVVTAGTVVSSWDSATSGAGTYTITLTNASTLCPGDLDDGNGGGNPDCGVDINDLLYFLAGFDAGSLAVDIDDGNGNGVKDCATDINDLLYFLGHFDLGC